MSSEQQKYDLPAGVTGRVRSTSSGLRKPRAMKAGKFGLGMKTVLVGQDANEPTKPYSPPSFLGMFDLPADASENVKAVVRGQDVA
ncbi:hypothetical protein ACFWMR_05430 [Amycolatopsis thailandensis]|uniref:hypothetical protein n=1 Tax=Amycolatopsis thailandensis TaxID=589330 RepID=UPI0036527AB1